MVLELELLEHETLFKKNVSFPHKKMKLLISFADKYGCPKDEMLQCIKQTLDDFFDEAMNSTRQDLTPNNDTTETMTTKVPTKQFQDIDTCSIDDVLLGENTIVPSFDKLNVMILMRICKKLGVKKYTTMNKEKMVNALNEYKIRYNSDDMFRFHTNFVQKKCNKPKCDKSIDLQEHDGCLWKYCAKHCRETETVLLQWDKIISTPFMDTTNNILISVEDSNVRFLNKESRISSLTKRVLPFAGSLRKGVKKLTVTKQVKTKHTNVRHNLNQHMKATNLTNTRNNSGTKMKDMNSSAYVSSSPIYPSSPMDSSHGDNMMTATEIDDETYVEEDDVIPEGDCNNEDEEDEDEEEEEEEEGEDDDNEEDDEENMAENDEDIEEEEDNDIEDGEIVPQVEVKRKAPELNMKNKRPKKT